MKKLLAGLVVIGAILVGAAPAQAATANQWSAYHAVDRLCGGSSNPFSVQSRCLWRQGPDSFHMFDCGAAYKCWNDGLTHREGASVGFAGSRSCGSHGTVRQSTHVVVGVAEAYCG